MYFPLFLDLSQKEVLVVGAGRIASRRIRALCGFAGRITVVALQIPAAFGSRIAPDVPDFRKSAGKAPDEKTESLHETGEMCETGKICGTAESEVPADDMEVSGTRIRTFERSFLTSDLEQKDLVLAATDDAELNARIGALCRAKGIPVNICTDAEDCDFQFPSIVEDGAVVVGINASGKDHRLVKETRQRIETLFENADFRSRYENR
ncbi:MAG: bifunctional precorrin-2 dehydrogenase/sirohydrochlorin ferrochelatase [Lachnospiraceae bacterium]|nr:bifunctional precorrin-2 dehydrogenase/sirohydrochlorin ferrochelatase [Lachnospiraceae bacterium]